MTKEQMKASAWVCVLADDDTFTGLDGCWIAMTTKEEVEARYSFLRQMGQVTT